MLLPAKFPDDSGIEEELAGGGPVPTGWKEDRVRIRALTDQMTAETLGVPADITCVTNTCMCAVKTMQKRDWLFLVHSVQRCS
jgi:hypothetical protein